MERYTGPTQSGMTTDFTQGSYYVCDQVEFSVVYWTTNINYNRPMPYFSPADGASAEVSWSDSEANGIIYFKKPGTLNLNITICYGNTSTTYVSANKVTCQVQLRFPAGTYFIQNRENEFYMRVDKGDAPEYNNEGGISEIQPLDGGEYQRWIFTHLEYEYYSIKSAVSGLALTVPPGKETSDNTKLVLSPFSATSNNQKWKMSLTRNGSYKIKAKSSESYTAKDLVMDLADYLFLPENTDVYQRAYADNSSYRDEWKLMKIGYSSTVKTEGQKRDDWCWVASARMFAKHFYPQVTRTQKEAVDAIHPSFTVSGGLVIEAQAAILYYISPYELETARKEHLVYSKEMLIKFLNDGYVMYITRGTYSDINSRTSRTSGHATLIIGYVIIDSKYWFIIKDPWPVNYGETYLMSYEKIYNGRNALDVEESDKAIWESTIVINANYADQTIKYFFDS